MTVKQLLENTTSEELATWMAIRVEENKQKQLSDLMARAQGARR